MPKIRHVLPLLLIPTLSAAIYSNTLRNGFTYDDDATLRRIKNITIDSLFTQDYFAVSGEISYRPVVTLTYLVDNIVFQSSPWGYHLTNIVIHTLNTILLYLFVARLCKPLIEAHRVNTCAMVASLLFSVNPVLTEAVNNISFREDLLVFMFSFLAFHLYILSLRRTHLLERYTIYSISCICYALAVFSKEMAITLPILLLLWELLSFHEVPQNKVLRLAKRLSGFIIATALYLYIRLYYLSNPSETYFQGWAIIEALLTLPYLLFKYINLILFPFSLSADHTLKPVSALFTYDFLLPFAVALFIGCSIYYRYRYHRTAANTLLFYGILFFLIALIPVSNLFPISNHMAERYLYFPMAGISIIAAYCGYCINLSPRWNNHKVIFGILFTLIISSYSFTTIYRNRIWRDNYTLWNDTAKKMPFSYRAHYNLGNIYRDKLLLDNAIKEYRIAIEINPKNPDGHANLGTSYRLKGLLDEAISQYEEVLKLNPQDHFATYHLGNIYSSKGMHVEALKAYKKLLAAAPHDRFAKKLVEDTLRKLSSADR